MLTAQIGPLADGGLQEMQDLLKLHYDELALNKDKVPLDPQYPTYLARERLGEVLYVTLRDDGRLVGYFVGFIAPGMHYKTCLTLLMDLIFIDPEHRNQGGGHMLYDVIETEARRRGVQRWFMGTKNHSEASQMLGKLLATKGFEPVETIYSKWIGD